MPLRNKRGELRISRDLLFDENGEKYLAVVFSKFFPIWVEPIFNTFHYIGMCQEFDGFPEGSVRPFPLYDAQITDNEGAISVKFIKQ